MKYIWISTLEMLRVILSKSLSSMCSKVDNEKRAVRTGSKGQSAEVIFDSYFEGGVDLENVGQENINLRVYTCLEICHA